MKCGTNRYDGVRRSRHLHRQPGRRLRERQLYYGQFFGEDSTNRAPTAPPSSTTRQQIHTRSAFLRPTRVGLRHEQAGLRLLVHRTTGRRSPARDGPTAELSVRSAFCPIALIEPDHSCHLRAVGSADRPALRGGAGHRVRAASAMGLRRPTSNGAVLLRRCCPSSPTTLSGALPSTTGLTSCRSAFDPGSFSQHHLACTWHVQLPLRTAAGFLRRDLPTCAISS